MSYLILSGSDPLELQRKMNDAASQGYRFHSFSAVQRLQDQLLFVIMEREKK